MQLNPRYTGDLDCTTQAIKRHTDASGTLGYGGILGNKWFQGRCKTQQQLNAPGVSIAWQELFALVVACHIWGDEFANKRIVFYCDNASVVCITNSKRSRIPRVMNLSSIKGYLAAVRQLHIRSGYQLDLKKFVRLQLICRRIKRSQGDSSRVRPPISITHLKLFSQRLAIPNTTNHGSIMIWEAMTLAFFGFLRLGKMTCNSPHSRAIHLSPSDVTLLPNALNPEHMSVKIKNM